jgi:hypothetical protein
MYLSGTTLFYLLCLSMKHAIIFLAFAALTSAQLFCPPKPTTVSEFDLNRVGIFINDTK